MTCTLSLITYPGIAQGPLLSAAELLNHANHVATSLDEASGQVFKLQFIAAEGEAAPCSLGYPLPCDGGFDQIPPNSIVLFHANTLAALLERDRQQHAGMDFSEWLRTHLSRLWLFACNFEGSRLLADQGLWQSAPATLRQRISEMFKEQGREGSFGIHADNVICTPDGSAMADLCMAVLEKYCGKNFARTVAQDYGNAYRPSALSSYLAQRFSGGSALVARAEAWIQANLTRDVKVEELASHLAVSSRTLIRHFQEHVQLSPQQYLQQLRIEKCKLLLSTTSLRFSQIVDRCGYSDESALRKVFKKACHLSPSEYRKQFGFKATEA
ncbi:GlxA family transcriptional regulator [Pokkaliibacter sp. CJK22405]|uniref:GlxA family transcriptional regulator n=1 Tax=Pokkaliibacter sp. CJK22405 TaxID=3384615 RepID=UPI003984BD47